MEKMANEVAGMRELQEGLMKKIKEIPDKEVRKILSKEASRELKSILQVEHLLEITSVEELAQVELTGDQVSFHFLAAFRG